MSGTRRMLTFATAFAGITVFTPAPARSTPALRSATRSQPLSPDNALHQTAAPSTPSTPHPSASPPCHKTPESESCHFHPSTSQSPAPAPQKDSAPPRRTSPSADPSALPGPQSPYKSSPAAPHKA